MTKCIKFVYSKETDFERISFEEVSINKLDKCHSMLGNELCYFIIDEIKIWMEESKSIQNETFFMDDMIKKRNLVNKNQF